MAGKYKTMPYKDKSSKVKGGGKMSTYKSKK